MPELSFDSLEALPEELRSEAKEAGGKFVVNLVSAKKLTEFRENNVRLLQENDGHKTKVTQYGEIVGADPEKFKADLVELRKIAQQVKDGTLKGSDAVERAVTERLSSATDAIKTQLAELGTKHKTAEEASQSWKSKYERSVLQQQITSAVIGKDSVANPEALPDILSRAEGTFVVQPDGTLLPKKGDATLYGPDGASPMTVKEWLTKLVAEAHYLGKGSTGGGANGNRNAIDESYGMSSDAFQKLPPAERIRIFRQSQSKK